MKNNKSILGNIPKLAKKVIDSKPAPEIDEVRATEFIEKAPVRISPAPAPKAEKKKKMIFSVNISVAVVDLLNSYHANLIIHKSKKKTKSDIVEAALVEYISKYPVN